MFEGVLTYLREARTEIRKVSWPTRQQTIRYTIAVIVMSLVVAAFLGGLDFVFRTILNRVLLR
ncbi:preprotein translocase subunit SecE [Candidatus Parcubacteria bacterium]|nr:MAG: preprotein translocase subunit SecE [Candidatus Parcubacteria bacterium]